MEAVQSRSNNLIAGRAEVAGSNVEVIIAQAIQPKRSPDKNFLLSHSIFFVGFNGEDDVKTKTTASFCCHAL
jgi:hypothetical protein